MKHILPPTLLTFLPFTLFAQFYPVHEIPTALTQDAYAVVRSANTHIQLNTVNQFKYSEEVVITVFDKSGDPFVNAHQFYDPNTKIEAFEAELYDAQGKMIEKFKSKNFSDVSAVSGGQLYTDDRVKYLAFTPTFYPYTIRYKVSTVNKNTIFIPRWSPIYSTNLSIESAQYTFTNNSTSTIRHLEKNVSTYPISKEINGNEYRYALKNLKPMQSEEMMVNWRNIVPQVIFATNQINIDGTQGTFDNWNDYGKWSYQNLIQGKLDFTPVQKAYFQNLVNDAQSEKEKVSILYKHLQNKVRYIGVQLGIGGLSPFPNSYVETRSYGDCKALSNYMIGMLDAVGIKAYHTILFADNAPIDIDEEMMYQQGNHMIVYVPLKEEDIWVEATSQSLSFNLLGDMSSNRKVYIFDEHGGKIIPSQTLNHTNNILTTKGRIEITSDGKAKITLHEISDGLFYADNSAVKSYVKKDQMEYFRRKFPVLAQPKIDQIEFKDHWDKSSFETILEVTSDNFAKKQGNHLIFNLIPGNNETTTLKKAKTRVHDFHISRGYTDKMSFEIIVPSTIKGKIQFEPIHIVTEFGSYDLKIEQKTENTYLLTRTYQQIKGNYDSTKFNDYVEFRRQVAANDNIKTLLEF